MRSLARVLGFAALASFAGCDRSPEAPAPVRVRPVLPPTELVVAVRPGPAMFYAGPDGQPAGLDADLVRLFAARKHLPVRFVPVGSGRELTDTVARGAAHLAVGGLYRPSAPVPISPRLSDPVEREDVHPALLWTSGYMKVEPVLIYNTSGFRPTRWHDLDGDRVTYMQHAGLETQVARLRAQHPKVEWEAADVPAADALVAQVSEGALDYAIVPSNVAAVSRNIYMDFDVVFAVDGARDLAWALPADQRELQHEIDGWLGEIRRNGTLAKLIDRHFGHVNEVPRIDAGILRDRIGSVLPQFRQAFERAQQATGIEWRLLAAVAYQESQWDPQATSETGVRGLMQITEETARHLGVVDRLDPRVSIQAAARYLRDLKSKLPSRIQEPDRTWLALAAFNIGLGHLEDARVLAQKLKLNPDAWTDVKKALPLLAQPEHYETARLGYARGGMPVAFVDRVRAYYDVLLAHEPLYRPRLQVTAQGERRASTGLPVAAPVFP